MHKAFSAIIAATFSLTVLLCGCDKTDSDESSTDYNEQLIEIIDKSTPITDGNLITKTNTDNDGNINVDYYDNNGNLVEQFLWEDDANKTHTVMTYSQDNKMLTKEELSPDGQSNVVYSYQYDEKNSLTSSTESVYSDGALSKSVNYDAENNETGRTEYHYNDSKQLIRIERFDNSEIAEYFEYEYNTEGLASKYASYSADGKIKKYTTFEYNDQSLISVEYSFDSSDVLQNRIEYEYYASGEMKSCTKYDSNGNILTQSTFDDKTE